MRHFTTGEVRRLFSPPLAEHRITNAIRSGKLEPEERLAGRFLWSIAEIRRLAEILGLAAPTICAETSAHSSTAEGRKAGNHD